MCGRYEFSTGIKELAPIAASIEQLTGQELPAAGEIFPSQSAPILLLREGQVQPRLASWGFEGGQRGRIINARAETAEKRVLFRESLAQRRCVVPTAGFYEWDKAKHKYRFRLPGSETVYLAGLYDITPDGLCFCILTTSPNASMNGIHDRMPLILNGDEMMAWLGDTTAAKGLLNAPQPLLERQCTDGQLTLW